MSKFDFQPRWKEELIVSGDGGQFALELSMGVLSAYLPTETVWELRSPEWARKQYAELKQELGEWCKDNKAKLYVTETAGVCIDGAWS